MLRNARAADESALLPIYTHELVERFLTFDGVDALHFSGIFRNLLESGDFFVYEVEGTVVGFYFGSDRLTHGFIFHNGHYATLDYPHAPRTFLVGITNAGKIIGNAFFPATPSNKPFLYENGTFKVISLPHSVSGSPNLMSISPRRGLILGVTGDYPNRQGFIATCQ